MQLIKCEMLRNFLAVFISAAIYAIPLPLIAEINLLFSSHVGGRQLYFAPLLRVAALQNQT